MTVAVTLKVNDGIVLSADSASSMMGPEGVSNVYNNANKIFNLRKGLPIGLITWGLGSLGGLSISILAKELRARLSGEDPDFDSWRLDEREYSIRAVADRVREFFYEEHYKPEADEFAALVRSQIEDGHMEDGASPEMPRIGFMVAGYSSSTRHAETYNLDLNGDSCDVSLVAEGPEGWGVTWAGQSDAISRLVNGFGDTLPFILEDDLGLDGDDLDYALEKLGQGLAAPLVNPGMPFQDAIELAEFFVGLAIGYSRFMPGAPTVGGPVETAAITKHEGFKWVKRKHFFDSEFNPEI